MLTKARRQLCCLAVLTAQLVCLCVQGASAPPPQPPEQKAEVLARLPRTVELALVIDNLTKALEHRGGKALIGALDDLDVIDPGAVVARWAPLSAQLGWPPAEAFDRLLGARVVLVVRGVETPQERRWAVMSEVTAETEGRITQRLELAPRKIVAGHPVYAVEMGRYELTTVRRPKVERQDGRNVTLVLAESGRAEILDELVEVLARGARDPLRKTGVPKAASALEPSDALLAVRIDPEPAGKPAAQDWTSFAVLGIRTVPQGLDCGITLRDRSMEAELTTIQPSTDCALRAVEDSAILAAVECRPPRSAGKDGKAESLGLEQVLNMLDPPAEIVEHLTGRMAIALQCVPAPTPAPGAPGDAGGERSALRVLIGLESGDIRSLAPLGDRCVAQQINRVETAFGRQPQPIPEYAGTSPAAVRQVRLDLPQESLPARFLGGPVNVAWTFACPKAMGKDDAPCDRGGWWLASIGGDLPPCPETGASGCTSLMKRTCRRIGETRDQADSRRWFSIGIARPSRWPEALGSRGLPLPPGLFAAAARVSEASWRIRVTDTQDLSGELRINLVEPAPATPGGSGR